MLAYLAVESDRPHSRQALSNLLWPEWSHEAALNSLRNALAALRRVIGDREAVPPFLLISRETIQFNRKADSWVDVPVFEALAQFGGGGRPESLAGAIDLCRGLFLEGFALPNSGPFEDWLMLWREQLREKSLQILRQLADFNETRAEYEKALGYAQKLISLDPLSEESQRQVMRLLAFTDRRGAALAQYEICCRILSEELDLEPDQETTIYYELIRSDRLEDLHARLPSTPGVASHKDRRKPDNRGRGAPAELHDLAPESQPENLVVASKNNLPRQLTSFIGRSQEIAEVRSFFDPGNGNNRCLTLVGPGGCGKTRLAVEAVTGLVNVFPDGVWMVELVKIFDPQMTPRAVIETLGLYDDGKRSPFATLTDFIGSKKLLLVMDNCEHLVEICAELVSALLMEAPNLCILASSREALGIAGERVFRVPSLSLQDIEHQQEERLLHSEAVQLFYERARAVLPKFEITSENVVPVAEVCRRLDGIPLAIELAAIWVPILRPEQIAARLSDAFRLLTGGSRAALPRQQTLRATLDWSYDLLSELERTLLSRLSIFTDGWRLEAAESVCAGGPIVRMEILDLIHRLVKKSLVSVVQTEGPEPRYHLLEITRQYSAEKLHLGGEAATYRTKHLNFYAQLAQKAEIGLEGGEQVSWLHRLNEEYFNIRAALAWSFEGEVRPGLEIVASLGYFWHMHGDWVEGHRWHEKALAAFSDADPKLKIKILNWIGFLEMVLEENQPAISHLKESIALSQKIDAPQTAAFALYCLSYYQEYVPKALELAEQSLELFKQAGNLWGQRQALGALGTHSQLLGDYQAADAFFQRSLELSREVGDQDGIGWSQYCLGCLHFQRSDFGLAWRYLDGSLFISRWLRNKPLLALTLQKLGQINLANGNVAEAKEQVEQSLELSRELGDKNKLSAVVSDMGHIELRLGNFQNARTFFEQSVNLSRKSGANYALQRSLAHLSFFELLHGQLAAAKKAGAKALEIGRQEGIPIELTLPLKVMGMIELQEGDFQLARAFFEESFEISQKSEKKEASVAALYYLAATAGQMGDLVQVFEKYQASLQLSSEMHEKEIASLCYSGLAVAFSQMGDQRTAVHFAAAAETALAYFQLVLLPVLRSAYQGALTEARNQLGEAGFASAWEEGRALASEQVFLLLFKGWQESTARASSVTARKLSGLY